MSTEIISKYQSNKSVTISSLCKEYGLTGKTVASILKNANIAIRRSPHKIDNLEEIKNEYLSDSTLTVASLSRKYNIDCRFLKRQLKLANTKLRQPGGISGHVCNIKTKNKIAEANTGNYYRIGTKHTLNTKIKLMSKLGGLSYEYLKIFDYEKLRFINIWMGNALNLPNPTPENKMKFIERFYFDPIFNKLYDTWLIKNKNRWYRPSLDHIISTSKGGTNTLDNLQVMTWFENRAKAEMTDDEWQKFKLETNTKSDLFT